MLRKFLSIPLARFVERLRHSFWFLPAVAVIAAILTAEWLVIVDHKFSLSELPGFAWTSTTPDAARGILTTLVGSLTSVTGVVLSMMLLILSQTSTQLGPRVVRTVISGNQLQATVATLLATIAFSLTTIRTIRSDDAPTLYVPETATILCVALFFMSLGALIYFVHHVAQMIQAPTVLARIATEFSFSIEANCPPATAKSEFDDQLDQRLQIDEKTWAIETAVTARDDGYLQGFDAAELIEIARRHDIFVKMVPQIGHFVRSGGTYCTLCSESAVDADAVKKVRQTFFVGIRRTPEQDVLAPLMELAEIGVRVLSPGINDPRTACMCVDRLTAGLIEFSSATHETMLRLDCDGTPRLLANVASVNEAIEASFEGIVHYGRTDPVVQAYVERNLSDLQNHVTDSDAKNRIASLLDRLQ